MTGSIESGYDSDIQNEQEGEVAAKTAAAASAQRVVIERDVLDEAWEEQNEWMDEYRTGPEYQQYWDACNSPQKR